MKPERDDALCARYPVIFAQRYWPDTESAMGRGFECGDGWYTLIDALCACLQHETEYDGAPQVVATQVKSKLGSLRFYTRNASQRQRAMIALAGEVSMRMCEECGAPGEVVKNVRGWISVNCESHRS